MKYLHLTAVLLGLVSASNAVVAAAPVAIPTPAEQAKLQQGLMEFAKPFGANKLQIDDLLKQYAGHYESITKLMADIDAKHKSNQSAGGELNQVSAELNLVTNLTQQINALVTRQNDLITNGIKQLGNLPVFADLNGKLELLRQDMAKKTKTNADLSAQLAKSMETEKKFQK